ncbi:helix-turn-helix domain-containing protein [Methanocaldococcus sp.]
MKVYNAKQVAEILGVSPTTVVKWIRKGIVKAEIQKKMQRNYYKIPEDEVLRLKKELGVD